MPAQLEREALSLRDIVFQGITHIAPAVNVVFTLPIIAEKAGAAMPLSLMLSAVVCVLIANTVAQFSRYVPSSGGYYTFVTRGLGPRVGFVTTWSYLIYEIVGPAATVGVLGYMMSGFVPVPWWGVAIVLTVIVWFLTYFSIRLSTHTTAVLGGIEMLILLALGVTFLFRPGENSSALAPLNPASAPGGWHGVLGGMVFSILALSGFEAPAPLAQESKRPTRFIYLAIYISLFIVGVFYVFMAYASAIGWGTANMAAFTDEKSYFALIRKVWGAGWWLVFFALLNSALALGISGTNAATRVIYTMALAGKLPAVLGCVHPRHHTPYIAVHVQQILQIACFLTIGLSFGPSKIFEFLGTIGSLGVILLYALANVALGIYVWQRQRQDFSIWRHAIVPLLGTLILGPVAYITVYPVQPHPLNLPPYVFVGLMVVGIVAMCAMPRKLMKDSFP